MNEWPAFWIGLTIGSAVVGALFALPAAVNYTAARNRESGLRGEAVKRNHAEWIVDPATGATTFAWKPLPGDPISPREIELRNK